MRWVPNIYELHQSGGSDLDFYWPHWIRETFKFIAEKKISFLELMSNLSSFLTCFNCSITVYIYFIKHGKFVMSLVWSGRNRPIRPQDTGTPAR